MKTSPVLITCLLCIFVLHARAQDKLQIELREAPKPDVYIDGKKYDHAVFELLDQSKIESVTVIKDERAIKEYNAPNGVIIVKTKKTIQTNVSADDKGVKISDASQEPVIVINGKISDRQSLSKLSPDAIESIDVLKGQKAIDQYNAPNGAIVIKTKN